MIQERWASLTPTSSLHLRDAPGYGKGGGGGFRQGHLSGFYEVIQRQARSCSEMCLNDGMCLIVCVMFWFDES